MPVVATAEKRKRPSTRQPLALLPDAGAARAVGAVTVLVSHRFSTVRLADRIVVLDGGRVVGQGAHEELTAAGGLYAELYGLPARAYR